jgi:hypothetical protein
MLEIIFTIFWTFLLAFSIRYIPFFRNINGLSYSGLLLFFLLKVITGSVYILIYTYHFEPKTSDVHRFFNEGKVIYSSLFHNPLDYFRILSGFDGNQPHLQIYYQQLHYWFFPERPPLLNDNRLIIGFNAVANLFSFGSIHTNSALANFISFSGLVALYKFGLNHVHKINTLWLKLGIFLMPSVLFWGSGLNKEVLLLPVLGFFLYFFDKIIAGNHLSIKQILMFAATLVLLLWLKVYVFILLIPCLIAYFLSAKIKSIRTELIFIAIPAILLAIVLVAAWVFPQFDPILKLTERQNFFMTFSVLVGAGSIIHEVYLEPNIGSILAYAPQALLNVLVRPHFFDNLNPLIIMAVSENILIAGMLATIVFYALKKKKLSRIQCLGISFTLLLFVFIGLTTQVYGTLVRLKIPALPLLWISFLSILPPGKMNHPAIQSILQKLFTRTTKP